MHPLVSVVVPAWNAERFLTRALDASLNQRGVEVEVIVVDDGSTDATRSVALSRAERDRRVTVLSHATMKGPSAARNTALDQASGDWIALLDADDSQEPDRLCRLIEFANARDLDMVSDDLVLVDDSNGQRIGYALNPGFVSIEGRLRLEDLLNYDWPGRNAPYLNSGLSKPVMRRSFIVGEGLRYDQDIRLGEDLLFYSTALLRGARLGVTSEALYLYSVRAGSTSRRRRPTLELVDVNKRIGDVARHHGASVELLQLIRERDQALKFQVFTWALKERDVGIAFQSLKGLALANIVRLGVEGLKRRSRRRAGGKPTLTVSRQANGRAQPKP